MRVNALNYPGSGPGQLRIAICCQQDVLAGSVLRWLAVANVTATRERALGRVPDEPIPDALIVFADDYPTLEVISSMRLVVGNKSIRHIALVTGAPRELDLLRGWEGARDRLVILPQPASGMDLLDLVFSIAARLTVDACRGVAPSCRGHES